MEWVILANPLKLMWLGPTAGLFPAALDPSCWLHVPAFPDRRWRHPPFRHLLWTTDPSVCGSPPSHKRKAVGKTPGARWGAHCSRKLGSSILGSGFSQWPFAWDSRLSCLWSQCHLALGAAGGGLEEGCRKEVSSHCPSPCLLCPGHCDTGNGLTQDFLPPCRHWGRRKGEGI